LYCSLAASVWWTHVIAHTDVVYASVLLFHLTQQMVQGLWLKVEGLGSRVHLIQQMVQGLGSKVEGWGFLNWFSNVRALPGDVIALLGGKAGPQAREDDDAAVSNGGNDDQAQSDAPPPLLGAPPWALQHRRIAAWGVRFLFLQSGKRVAEALLQYGEGRHAECGMQDFFFQNTTLPVTLVSIGNWLSKWLLEVVVQCTTGTVFKYYSS